MNAKLIVRGFVVASLAASLLLPARPARAGRLGPDILALFPKETGEIAYADLKKARTMPWFPQLKDQLLPARFHQFEQFLASAGIDPNSQVDEVAWALVAESAGPDGETKGVPSSENIVGIALGTFNPDSAEAFFRAQKLPTFKVRTYSLYAFGSGAGPNDLFFLFIDSNTAAFGHRKLLEKMVEIRFGAEEGLLRNDKFFPLVNEANGTGVVWAVLNPSYTRLALHQLAPEVEQFPDAAKLIRNLRNLIIGIDAGSGIDSRFQAVAASPEDANTLAQLLTAGFLYKRYEAQQSNNLELAQLLDAARIVPSGDRVELRMSLNNDQMTSLIKHNTFALKM
jgi:hypothetical protein